MKINIFRNFVSKSNNHNNGTIYIQLFTLYRAAVDVILRLLFFVCQDTGKENFRELSPLPANNGCRTAVACRQLFGTFLFRNKVQKCQFGHIDESVHLLFVLLPVQLSTDNTARPFLHNAQKVMDTHYSMGYLLNPFRCRIIASAWWYHAEVRIAGFGCMAGDLRVCACPKSHCRIPQSRQDF